MSEQGGCIQVDMDASWTWAGGRRGGRVEQRQMGGVNVDKGGWKVGECMSRGMGTSEAGTYSLSHFFFGFFLHLTTWNWGLVAWFHPYIYIWIKITGDNCGFHGTLLMSLAYSVLLYTHLFLLFYYFLYITDPLPHTLLWPHARASAITHLHSIRPALFIWWTDNLQFTCHISILSYLMHTLPWPNQSWVIMLHGQGLIIVSPQMSLVLTFLIIICI